MCILQNDGHGKMTFVLQGSDWHVAATLLSDEGDRTIKASFFFDSKECPEKLAVGEKLRLIGIRLQMWRGYLQLTGKNVQFGHSLMAMSLSDAIAAWSVVTRAGAEKHFPKLTTMVIVKMWSNPKETNGASCAYNLH